jgi:RES domain-containing protein
VGQAWRIVKESRAVEAFSGEGAVRYGGRWNSRGTRLVYTSSTRALAMLELLVHLNPPIHFRMVVIRVEFPDALVERLPSTALAGGWREAPPPPATKVIGDQWVREARSAVLEPPSVIVPEESNYLLNPAHPQFAQITIGPAELFSLDPRLLT